MGARNGKPVISEEDVETLAKTSDLDPAQVRAAFDAFLAENPNGKMKPKAFREMMTKALPKADAKKMEKHVFRMFDSDRDGFIDFAEFMLIFHIMSDGDMEEVLGKIFRVFDVDGDGTISKKEMDKVVKDMFGLLKTDASHIGDQASFVKDIFSEMDKDNDGKITESEFIRACMEQQEMSKLLAIKIVNIFVEEDLVQTM